MENQELSLFFALPLPEGLRQSLGQWQKGHPRIIGWCRPGGLHLTLAFLGAGPPERLPALAGAGALAAGRHGPFSLRTAGLGGFPSGKAARVLWLGLEPCSELEALVTDLRGVLLASGEAFDPKPFRPHISLARFRWPLPIGGLPAPAPMAFEADDLVLFESQPQTGYVPLRSWPLG